MQHQVQQQGLPLQQERRVEGKKGAIYTVGYNWDGEYVMSGGQSRVVSLYSAKRGSLIKEYSGPHNQEVLDIAM